MVREMFKAIRISLRIEILKKSWTWDSPVKLQTLNLSQNCHRLRGKLDNCSVNDRNNNNNDHNNNNNNNDNSNNNDDKCDVYIYSSTDDDNAIKLIAISWVT